MTDGTTSMSKLTLTSSRVIDGTGTSDNRGACISTSSSVSSPSRTIPVFLNEKTAVFDFSGSPFRGLPDPDIPSRSLYLLRCFRRCPQNLPDQNLRWQTGKWITGIFLFVRHLTSPFVELTKSCNATDNFATANSPGGIFENQ